MERISYIIRLKPFAELKNYMRLNNKIRNRFVDFCSNNAGGGFGTLFIGLSVILLLFIAFLNIADYSVYTYKRNQISKAMDYAVTSASQQVDWNGSIDGISIGFSDATGKKLLEDVQINIEAANTTFLSVFYKNYSSKDFSINKNLLLCTTSFQSGRLKYIIRVEDMPRVQGQLEEPTILEDRINDALNAFWPDSSTTKIFVRGNPKTNMIEKGTYIFAVIKDVEIKGLFTERKISLSCFAGAKLERLVTD